MLEFWQKKWQFVYKKIGVAELCKGMHCVDLGESFQTHTYLQNLASIQPKKGPPKFGRSSGAAFKNSSSSGAVGDRGGVALVAGGQLRAIIQRELVSRRRPFLFDWPEDKDFGLLISNIQYYNIICFSTTVPIRRSRVHYHCIRSVIDF